MHCKAVSAISLLTKNCKHLRGRELANNDPLTFKLVFQHFQVLLVRRQQPLFEVSLPQNELTGFLGLFCLRNGTNSIPWNDVFENGHFRQDGQFPDDWIVGYRFWVCRR